MPSSRITFVVYLAVALDEPPLPVLVIVYLEDYNENYNLRRITCH